MTNNALVYLDAPAALSTTGLPVGAPIVTFPLAEEQNYAKLYIQPYIVNSGFDSVGSIGSAGLYQNTYLVSESDREPLSAEFVTYSKQFAEIPSGYNDFQTYTYTYPALLTVRPTQKVFTVVARVYNDFHLTSNPQSITLSGAQRWLNVYGWDVTELSTSTATTPNINTYSGWVSNGTEFVAQDATLSRYIGPIWRRQTVYVKAK